MKRDKNMIIIQLNRQIFEYDVHSLVKSFYPGEDVKIVYETSPEEADAQLVCRLEFLKTVSNFKSEDTLPEQACEKGTGSDFAYPLPDSKERKNRVRRNRRLHTAGRP